MEPRFFPSAKTNYWFGRSTNSEKTGVLELFWPLRPPDAAYGDRTTDSSMTIPSQSIALMKLYKIIPVTVLLLSAPAHSQFVFTKIADTATAVSGDGVGTFTFISNPRIRDRLVVFSGLDGNGDQGIYRADGNGLSEVVFVGDAAPSLTGYTFIDFGFNPNPDGSGVTFGGRVSDGSNEATIVATAVPNGFGGTLTNRSDTVGTTSPDSGQVFEDIGGNGGNAAVSGGAIVYRGEESTTPSAGYYTDASGSLTTVINTSTPVPGLPGYTFTGFNSEPTFKGNIAINASITDGINFDEINMIATPAGVLVPVIDTVSSVSLSTGLPISNITRFAVDGDNYAVTALDLNGSRELLTNVGGGITTVADLNTVVPGQPAFTFDTIDSDDQSIDGQRIVFKASFDSSSQNGIYLWDAGVLHRIIDSTMLLDGKAINTLAVDLGSAISGQEIVFKVSFQDGSEAAYQATIPEPGVTAENVGMAQAGYGAGGDQYQAAQTFKARLSGHVGEVTVLLSSGGEATPFVTIALTEVVGGLPGVVLGTADIVSPTLDGTPTRFSADFSGQDIFLTQGTDYALTVSTPGSVVVRGFDGDPYSDGSGFVSYDFGATWFPFLVSGDFYFRVKVNVVADIAGDWLSASALPSGWSYFDSDAPNGGSEVALTAEQGIGNAGNRGFGGGSNGLGLGAVTGDGVIFADGTANGPVPGVDLALHPGDDSNSGGDGYDYLILRYTITAADLASGSLAFISGSFRELINNGGDSITVYVYLNSVEEWSATSVDGSILPEASGTFHIPGIPVSEGDTIDFVVYNNGTLFADEAAIRGTISMAKSNYELWAEEQGLVLGVNAAPSDDPNLDGRSNLEHYAFNTDPLGSGGNEGKTRMAIHQLSDPGGTRVFTYTIPMRSFDIATSAPSTTYVLAADGLNYYVRANQNLPIAPSIVIDEITPPLDAGLPVLDPAWAYRTFYLTDGFDGSQRGFIQFGVEIDN